MKSRFLTAILIWVVLVAWVNPYVATAQVITAPQIDALVPVNGKVQVISRDLDLQRVKE